MIFLIISWNHVISPSVLCLWAHKLAHNPTLGSEYCYPLFLCQLPPEPMSSVHLPPVLVSSSCHDKVPQTGWLKQQKFVSHSSGAWKSKVRCWQGWGLAGLSPWLADGYRLVVSSQGLSSSHGLSSMCACSWCPFLCANFLFF